MAVSPNNPNRVYDGQDMMLSVNSFIEPSKMRGHEIQWGFNVMTRGGKVRTRFGFRSVYKFAYGKAQGLSFFVPNTGVEQLIAAVSGRVYALSDPFTSANHLSAIAFNAQAPSVFFKQATVSKTPNTVVTPYPVLMMQDRYSRAAYTDGQVSRHLDPTPNGFYSFNSIGATETLIGFAMEWVGDRLWVERGRELFASDIADPLHFTENAYLFGGNSLQAIDGAAIRALARTADNKQLLVFTDQNTTRIAAGVTDRSVWGTTQDFVASLFPGVGCVGPKAVTDASGELAWMSQEGMRLYNAVGDSVRTAKNNVSSREMDRSWQARSRKFMSQVCASYHDGYTMFGMPCGDIFNRHLWVMDNSTSDTLDQQFPYAWQGVWTGIRPVEIASGVVNGELRTFCMSQDRDAVRIWEMFREDQLDGDCDIVCYFETKGNVYERETPMTFKRYKYSALHISDLRNTVDINLKYKNEFGCYREVASWSLCALQCRTASPTCAEGNLRVLDSQRRYLKTQEAEDECGEGGSPFRAPVGTTHTMKVSWSGRLSVRAIRHTGEQVEEPDIGECQGTEECVELSCCDTEPDYISCPNDPGPYGGYYGSGAGIVTIDPDPEPEPEPNILIGAFDAYWNFDEAGNASNANDYVGSLDLTQVGSPIRAAAHDNIPFCKNLLSATPKYYTAPGNSILSMGDIDYCFIGWFYVDAADFVLSRTLIAKDGTTNGEYHLFTRQVAGINVVTWFVRDSTGTNNIINSGGSVSLPQDWMWFYCDHKASTNTMRLMVECPTIGFSYDSGAVATTVTPAQQAAELFTIGIYGDLGQFYLNGYVASVGMKKGTVLDAAQIAYHYNSGLGVTAPLFIQ